jgi:hypothetical protein
MATKTSVRGNMAYHYDVFPAIAFNVVDEKDVVVAFFRKEEEAIEYASNNSWDDDSGKCLLHVVPFQTEQSVYIGCSALS